MVAPLELVRLLAMEHVALAWEVSKSLCDLLLLLHNLRMLRRVVVAVVVFESSLVAVGWRLCF